MTSYIIRRVLYAIPVLIGVNVITFLLFFYINTPENIARQHVGKRPTPESIEKWIREHNYNLPLLYNAGWKRIKSAGAKGVPGTETKANLPTNGKGTYKLIVETPKSKAEAAQRVLIVRSVIPSPAPPPPAGSEGPPAGQEKKESDTPAGKLTLPGEFSADGKLELPAEIGTRIFEFEFDPGTVTEGHEPVIQVSFTVKGSVAAPLPNSIPANAPGKPKKPPEISPAHRLALEFLDPNIPLGERITQTLFWQHSVRMLYFQYGKSIDDKPIWDELAARAGPSLSIGIPTFFISLILTILFGMIIAFHRGTYVDTYARIACIFLMSISMMFYIIFFQVVLGKVLRVAPISGYAYGTESLAFIWLPIFISTIASIPGGVRFYRIVFLEEVNKDYIRTARAKGLSEGRVMFVHTLRNAMLPILTNVVVGLPLLYTGSLLLESFFAIPGMGSYMLNGIQAQDFAVVQACVCLGSFIYVVSLIFTDISYTMADPRVRLD